MENAYRVVYKFDGLVAATGFKTLKAAQEWVDNRISKSVRDMLTVESTGKGV